MILRNVSMRRVANEALVEQGVPHYCVRVLMKLYEEQEGVVMTDTISRSFRILRGTKQGDPISPILFNSVLEHKVKGLQESWQKRGFGLGLQSLGRRLCNLRFADDILVLATSKRQLKSMIQELMQAVGKVGPELHTGKTKVSFNGCGSKGGETEEG